MENRRSRINYSIKRRFQLRLLAKVMLIVFVSVGLNALLFYLYSNREIGASLKHFHVNATSFLDLLLPAVIGSLVIGLVLAFVISVFLPHKIAGPLFRLERDLTDKLGEGNLTVKFTVRKSDEFKELADSLNVMTGKLKVKVERIKAASHELSSVVAASGKGDDETMKKISGVAEKLDDAIRGFKL